MNGQWIGDYEGSNQGQIIVNVDELSDHYRGIAYLNEIQSNLPGTAAPFLTSDKNNDFKFRVEVLPLHPQTRMIDTWENVKHFFPNQVIAPSYADVTGKWNQENLHLNWRTDINTFGTCILPRSRASAPSDLPAKKMSWIEFKNYIDELEGHNYLFRGQRKPWRLRTAFHRHGRADLYRFLTEDIQILHKNLSARTRHYFNLNNPDENGAFFNLVQHHGYPTPLLDWTYSPYVAVFFAYRAISNMEAAQADASENVRIHVFNHSQWKRDFPQFQQLLTSALHFSLAEFIAIDNERMIPQQATSSVTNIDDVESYIKSKENHGKIYLTAIDLPVSERKKVIQELQFMGITAGALFPGLDGACQELKERRFEW